MVWLSNQCEKKGKTLGRLLAMALLQIVLNYSNLYTSLLLLNGTLQWGQVV